MSKLDPTGKGPSIFKPIHGTANPVAAFWMLVGDVEVAWRGGGDGGIDGVCGKSLWKGD